MYDDMWIQKDSDEDYCQETEDEIDEVVNEGAADPIKASPSETETVDDLLLALPLERVSRTASVTRKRSSRKLAAKSSGQAKKSTSKKSLSRTKSKVTKKSSKRVIRTRSRKRL